MPSGAHQHPSGGSQRRSHPGNRAGTLPGGASRSRSADLVEHLEDRAAHTYAAMAPGRPSAPRRVRKPPGRPASRNEGRRAVGEDRYLTGWRSDDDTRLTSPAYRPAAPGARPAPVP